MPDLSELISLQREWSFANTYPLQYGVVSRWWAKACPGEEFDSGRNVLVVYARIGYELQARCYNRSKINIPRNVMNNLEALREWNIEKLSRNFRVMLKIDIVKSGQQQERDMVKKKEGKKVRSSVSQFYLEVFENQAKMQLVDEEIADVIQAKTGDRPSLKNVASYRCMYNAGKLQGQKGVPSQKAKAVRPTKEKIKKVTKEKPKAVSKPSKKGLKIKKSK